MGRVFGGIIFIIIIIGIVLWSFSRPLPPILDETKSPSPTAAPQSSPTPAGKSSTNITVSTPLENDTVGTTFQITGVARVFENVVSYRVKSQKSQQILASGVTTADAPDVGQFGEFSITVKLPEATTLIEGDMLQLEVFQSSAKDGSDTDTVTVLLKLQK